MKDTLIQTESKTQTKKFNPREDPLEHTQHVRVWSMGKNCYLQIRTAGRITNRGKQCHCFSTAELNMEEAFKVRDTINEWIKERIKILETRQTDMDT